MKQSRYTQEQILGVLKEMLVKTPDARCAACSRSLDDATEDLLATAGVRIDLG